MPIDWDWRLNDLYFNTRGEPDDLGCVWVIEDVPDGWDSTEFRPSVNDIPLADGGDVGEGYDGARVLHCTGAVMGPTVSAVEKAKRRLRQAVGELARADGQFHARPYEDGLPDQYCTVRKNGKVAFPSRPGPLAVEFDFLLVAGDPRKYSVAARDVTVFSATVAGGAPFPWRFPVNFSPEPSIADAESTNAGDLAAPYKVTFRGPLINPVLTEQATGQRIPLKTTLAVNRSITVNGLTQTVTDDAGQSVYAYYDDVKGTPLDELRIPAADEFGNPGVCSWKLRGRGAGTAVVTNQDVFA